MKFRYFFDAGSGVCLWAADNEAREKYGYAVDLKMLNLSKDIIGLGSSLIKKYDTSIDWEYPPNPSPWSKQDLESFRVEAKKLYLSIVSELSKDYEIENEVNT